MRSADVLCAVVLLAGALGVAGEGLRLGIGWSTDGPRPGFFVFYLGAALAVSAAVVIGQAWLRAGAPLYRRPFLSRGQLAPVVMVALPAAGMVVLTHVLGLYVAGALYLGGYMRLIGRHPWALTLLLAAGIPLVAFLIFEIWFLVPMPKGPLEAYLGY